MTTVFDAFPMAVEIWTLVALNRDTLTGISITEIGDLEVIVDTANSSTIGNSTTPAYSNSQDLLYVNPASPALAVAPLPLDPQDVAANYGVIAPGSSSVRRIQEVGVGKNQQNGVVEHYEFTIEVLPKGVE